MKKTCMNCHFLSRESTGLSSQPCSFIVESDQRKLMIKEDFSFVRSSDSLKCHMGVWDEGVTPGTDHRAKTICQTKRSGKCFFYHYQEGMLFPAAETLQKREQENSSLRRSNMYTRIGLYLAAIGLIANVVISVIRLTKSV